jgi:hypothetical protein
VKGNEGSRAKIGWLHIGLKFSFTLFYKKKLPSVLVEERLPAAAAQPAQGSSEPVAPRIIIIISWWKNSMAQLKSLVSLLW